MTAQTTPSTGPLPEFPGALAPRPDVASACWMAALPPPAHRAPQWLPVGAALGRITAEPVHAGRPSPWFACAAAGGLAVCSADLEGEPPYMLPAGYVDVVDSGDPLPVARDAVVPGEDVYWRGEHVLIDGPAPSGRRVRQIGEDIPVGTCLFPAGHRLRAVDLAVAAATGHTTLPLTRRSRVVIIPTGDEVRPLGDPLLPGEITESNSIMLAARVGELGGEASVTEVQPDEPRALAQQLQKAAGSADLVVVLAGSSAGRVDHTATAVASCGTVVVGGVGLRPGHPTVLGVLTSPASPTPVLGLSGDPAAAAVAFEVFAVPMLAALNGAVSAPRPLEPALLGSAIRSPRHAEEWVHVTLHPRAGRLPEARRCERGTGALRSLVDADGLVCVPQGTTSTEVGEFVVVHLLPGCPPLTRAEPLP